MSSASSVVRLSELTRSFTRGSAVVFRYATQSELFPLIEYEFEHERSKGFQATIQLCLDDKTVKNNPTFVAYLQGRGYQKSDALSNAGQDVYVTQHPSLQPQCSLDFLGRSAPRDGLYAPSA